MWKGHEGVVDSMARRFPMTRDMESRQQAEMNPAHYFEGHDLLMRAAFAAGRSIEDEEEALAVLADGASGAAPCREAAAVYQPSPEGWVDAAPETGSPEGATSPDPDGGTNPADRTTTWDWSWIAPHEVTRPDAESGLLAG